VDTEEEHGGSFVVDVPDVFKEAFVMEKDSKRFPKSGGWDNAVFNYDAASDKFTPDAKKPSDCGYACHTPVKAKRLHLPPYKSVEPRLPPTSSAPAQRISRCEGLFRRTYKAT